MNVQPQRTALAMLTTGLMLAGAVLVTADAPAHADTPAGSSGGSTAEVARQDTALTYSASPREITWDLAGTPHGGIEVELVDALSQTPRRLTGEQVRLDDAAVTIYPPALEAGTYVLTWKYQGFLGPVEGVRAVHVGRPVASVSANGEGLRGAHPAAALALLGMSVALAVGLASCERKTRRRTGRAQLVLQAASAAGLLLGIAGLATSLGAVSAVGSLLAMLGAVSLLAARRSFSGVQADRQGIALASGLVEDRTDIGQGDEHDSYQTPMPKLTAAWARGTHRALHRALRRGVLGSALLGAAGSWLLAGAGAWPAVTATTGAVGGACLVLISFIAMLARDSGAGEVSPGGSGDQAGMSACEYPEVGGQPGRVEAAAHSASGGAGAGTVLVLGAGAFLLPMSTYASRVGTDMWQVPSMLLLAGVFALVAFSTGVVLLSQRIGPRDSAAPRSVSEDAEHRAVLTQDGEDGSSAGNVQASRDKTREGRGGLGVAVGLLTAGVLAGTLTPVVFSQDGQARELPRSAQVSAQECLEDGNFLEQSTCLDYVFSAKARERGARAALDELGSAQGQFPQLRQYCHEVSHAIGRVSVQQENQSIARAFEAGYDVCDFGYYHGVIEGAAGGLSDEEFLTQAPGLCEELATGTSSLYFQCFHGIGHAAARRTNNDIDRGLGMCESISQATFVRPEDLAGALNGCGTGVTMEWFSIAQKAGLEFVQPQVSDIKDVCLKVSSRWQNECVEYLANTLDTSDPVASLRGISQWCDVNSVNMEACLRGVARTSAALRIDLGDVVGLCRSAPGVEASCVESYLIYLATTVEFDLGSIDRACRELDAVFTSGDGSACGRARQAAAGVLGSLDGKPESFAGRNSAVQPLG